MNALLIKILIGIIFSGVFIGGAAYIKTLVSDLAEAKVQVKATTEAFTMYADKAEKDIAAFIEKSDKLQSEYRRSRDINIGTTELLNGHDINDLTKKKPNMLERRINVATARLFSNLESASRKDRILSNAPTD